MKKSNLKIFISAGEPSGDMRGAELLRELKKIMPEASFFGFGGDLMAKEGVRLVEHIKNLSIVGVFEALKKLPDIRRHYFQAMFEVEKEKPSCAILIDYPGFNLKIAKLLKTKGIPVIYYIIPQVWAWGVSRVELLKRYTDKILVLFKFEEEFLKKYEVTAHFTGHPIVDNFAKQADIFKNDNLAGRRSIALLPGSRKCEIKNLLPVMLESAKVIQSRMRDVSFVLAKASVISSELYDEYLKEYPFLNISSVVDNTLYALSRADFAIAASGTVTLEVALTKKPFIIVYKSSIFTELCFNLFVRIPFLGLPNIIAGEEVVPEILQRKFKPDVIADRVIEVLTNSVLYSDIQKKLTKVSLALGPTGASVRTAKLIADFLSSKF
ncbi:lipid-A-disaccharide synthase [Candidatus Omnitrophus magneticus]|uniref:Lipid-A-disaccharide synthase n=1 Tax=Candidatus Omnitrophus magneticus TaxID=1609969 RepID=A0A0F0CND9_9BACT|nr:lipid-A-disaccharide synthase [Candidatus Omnitrophus magneticus]